MSDTITVICRSCREKLWIGQFPYRKPERAYIYTLTEHAQRQARFYMKHRGHDLVVVDSAGEDRIDCYDTPLVDFEDIDERSTTNENGPG